MIEEGSERIPKAVKLFEETAEKVSKRTAKIENLSSTNKSAEILEQLKNNEGLSQARKFADETSDEIAKGLRQADDLDPYPMRGMADETIETGENIGRTLRANFEEGMNLRDFNRKIKRLENKIQKGDVLSNIPHGISKSERSVATSAYRRNLKRRVERMYQNKPEMRENALRKLEESDIDHILDLQLGGSNTPRNFKSLHKRTNQRLGNQFSTQMPHGTRVPIIGIEIVQ